MPIRWSLLRLIDWHSMKRIRWSLQTLTDSNLPMQIGSNLLKQIHLS